MISVSACIIAKNEEKFIGECLERLKKYGFEIVVVDTGSTDHTKEIARQYTENIYDFEWCNDFGKARNYAISKASNDWIFNIDCDEQIEKIDIPKLMELFSQYPDGCAEIRLANFMREKPDAPEDEITVQRIFNRKYCRYQGRIHEQVIRKDGKSPFFFKAPVLLFHYGYALEEEQQKLKVQRNLTMLLEEREMSGESPYLLFQLGRTYRAMKEYEKASECYEKALDMDIDPKNYFVQLMIVEYIQTLLNLEQYEKALWVEELQEEFGDFTDYVFMLGQVYYANNQMLKAMQQFIKLMGMKEELIKGTTTWRAYQMMEWLYRDLGQEEMVHLFHEKYEASVPK